MPFLKKLFFMSLLVSVFSQTVWAQDKVIIQLKWLHQFQFAGYYAALEKGFFAEEGLEVVLQERNPEKNNILQVLNGDAHYGVADSALLLYQTHQKRVKIVAPIFQTSPNAIITLASSGIRSPDDLVGRKVRFYDNETEGFPIMAMLAEYDVLKRGVIRQPFSLDYSQLTQGVTDAIYGYSTNEPFVLREQGYDVHLIQPKHYGINMYGDMLFTTDEEVANNPQRVNAMRRAVIKGWHYALDNKSEMVDLIYSKYSQRKSKAALMFEAEALEQIVDRFSIPLGTLDEGRLQHMARIFARHGLLDKSFAVGDYVFFDKLNMSEKLSFNHEELDFMAQHRQLKVGIDPDWSPFDFVDDKGQHAGIAADYLALLSQRLGITFEVVYGLTWPQVLEKMASRELDLMAMAAHTPERAVYANFTSPYVRSPMVVVTDQDIEFLTDLASVGDKPIGVVAGYASHEWLKTNYPNLNLVLAKSTVDGLKKVSSGELFAFVDNLAAVSFLIKKEGLANLKISGQLPFSFDLAMGARNDMPILRNILQKGLDSISQEERTQIYQKWVQLEFDTRIDYRRIAPFIFAVFVLFVMGGLYTWRLRVLHGRLQSSNQQLQDAEEALMEKNAELEHLSTTDKLTGVFNRHKLDQALKEHVALAQRYNRPFSLVLFDLDHFKEVNDTYGHQVGDKVLQVFSQLVSNNIRRSDLFGRWGGEEFLLICPETDVMAARELANKLRNLMAQHTFEEGVAQTVSVGVTDLKAGQGLDSLISFCDKLLYQAKTNGRNRVVAG